MWRIRSSFAKSANLPPRPVVGLYVGWRGLSVSTAVLKEATFYARKDTAHRVGNGRMRDLLVGAERLSKELGPTTIRIELVEVGHRGTQLRRGGDFFRLGRNNSRKTRPV